MRHFLHFSLLIVTAICLSACESPTAPASPTPTMLITPTPVFTATAVSTPSPTPFPYPMHFEQVGQIGGVSDMLTLSGDTVTLRVGSRVMIVDVSNPAKPTVTGRSHVLAGSVKSVAALDHYALAGDGMGTLWVFDMPTSGDPQVVARLEVGGIVNDIAVSGQVGFLAAGDAGLVVVDLSDPAHPAIIARLAVEGSALRVAAANDLAWVGSDYQQPGQDCECLNKTAVLIVFDMHAPTSPVLLSETSLSGTYFDGLVVVGDRAYVNADLYDISDPVHPQRTQGGFLDVDAAADDYVFGFSNRYSSYSPLLLFSVYDTHTSTDVTTAIRSLPDDLPAVGRQIVVRGRLAYVAAFHGLAILDLGVAPGRKFIYSSPPDVYTPDWRLLGWLPTDLDSNGYGCCDGWSSIPTIEIACGYLFTDSNVWSLERPEDPQRIDNPASVDASCEDIRFREGGYSYLDRSDPANPARRSVTLDESTQRPAALHNNLLFMLGPDGSTSLTIYDIADPAHPQQIGAYTSMPEFELGDFLIVPGRYAIYNYAYLDSRDQLALDLADPSDPRPVDIEAPRLKGGYFAASDAVLYILDENLLKVFSGDDLIAPIATLDTPIPPGPSGYPGPQSYVEYADGRVVISTFFASQRTYMLTAIDVHDPVHPRLLAVNDASFYSAVGYKDHLYFYTFEDGISIFKLVPN